MKSWLVAAAFLILCVCFAEGKKKSLVESQSDAMTEFEVSAVNSENKLQKPVENDAKHIRELHHQKRHPSKNHRRNPNHFKTREHVKQDKRVDDHNNGVKRGPEKLSEKENVRAAKLLHALDTIASKSDISKIFRKRIENLKSQLEGGENVYRKVRRLLRGNKAKDVV